MHYDEPFPRKLSRWALYRQQYKVISRGDARMFVRFDDDSLIMADPGRTSGVRGHFRMLNLTVCSTREIPGNVTLHSPWSDTRVYVGQQILVIDHDTNTVALDAATPELFDRTRGKGGNQELVSRIIQ